MRNVVTLSVALLWFSSQACGVTGAPEPPDAYDCLTAAQCPHRLVVAHRGYHLDLPENSLASIRQAWRVGADLVEVDVRHTADEVLVLMHDGDVDRTTDGNGDVEALRWDEITSLQLLGSDPDDPESQRVPLFSQALQLADELQVMLYVDQKTSRSDLVLAEIQAGAFHKRTLVRDGADILADMQAQDPDLPVLVPVDNILAFEYTRDKFTWLPAVEISGGAKPTLVDLLHAEGVLVQQDVMALGDTLAIVGDYSGWKNYAESGVDIPQTDYPHLLKAALDEFEETGSFPDSGPGLF